MAANFDENISMPSREIRLIAGWLFELLSQIAASLETGRAPRSLGLEASLEEARGLQQALRETLDDLKVQWSHVLQEMKTALFPQLSSAERQPLNGPLADLQQELRGWSRLADETSAYLEKLRLLAAQEKSTPLALRLARETWAELQELALSLEPFRSV